MAKTLMAVVGVLLLLTSCGEGRGSDGEPKSVGGPSHSMTVAEARGAAVGTRLRVKGALIVSESGAVMCDALAESSPPQCPNGVPLTGLDRSIIPPDTPSVRGVTWMEALEVIVERTRGGLRYVDS